MSMPINPSSRGKASPYFPLLPSLQKCLYSRMILFITETSRGVRLQCFLRLLRTISDDNSGCRLVIIHVAGSYVRCRVLAQRIGHCGRFYDYRSGGDDRSQHVGHHVGLGHSTQRHITRQSGHGKKSQQPDYEPELNTPPTCELRKKLSFAVDGHCRGILQSHGSRFPVFSG